MTCPVWAEFRYCVEKKLAASFQSSGRGISLDVAADIRAAHPISATIAELTKLNGDFVPDFTHSTKCPTHWLVW